MPERHVDSVESLFSIVVRHDDHQESEHRHRHEELRDDRVVDEVTPSDRGWRQQSASSRPKQTEEPLADSSKFRAVFGCCEFYHIRRGELSVYNPVITLGRSDRWKSRCW